MAVRRSTLQLCPGSVLGRQFDDESWTEQMVRISEDSEDSEEEGVMLEQSSYCFAKILDQLRLRAMQQGGAAPPPPPSVAAGEQKSFERLVGFYFPGCEDFILGPSLSAGTEVAARMEEHEQDVADDY